MKEEKKCPVCNTDLGNTIPDFCSTCGWECGTDISLIPSLTKPSDVDLEYYRKKLDLARKVWNSTQSLSQDQAKRLDDKDREIEALRKQLEEKDKDKAAAEKKAAKAQDQIAALGKDKAAYEREAKEAQNQINALERDRAALEKELDEAQKRIKALEAGIQHNQIKINAPSKLSDISPEMIFVEGGSFLMGAEDEKSRDDEQPVHKVELSSFYIGKYPVTQKQWRELRGSNLAFEDGNGDNHPVYDVSWYDAIKYCNLLSLAEGLTPVYSILGLINPTAWGSVPTDHNKAWDGVICDWGANGYRLPTEAEWEYAARGGNQSKGYTYSGSNDIDEVAWYEDNSESGARPVGMKKANELGIYDMSGNVREWCWDRYGYYGSDFQLNPTGSETGKDRVLRGGSWSYPAAYCRVACRYNYFPYFSHISNGGGFRLCRTKT